MSWIKYFFIALLFFSVIWIVTLVSIKHQANVTSTQSMYLNLSSINVGEARDSLKSNMNKDILEANLLLKIAETQKKHDYDTSISYVFLDEEGNITTDEDDIRSVQYRVEIGRASCRERV